jgi:hypothetical protein
VHPDLRPPFRFAVLFTPGIVISPDKTYKTKEIRSFLDKLDKGDIDRIIKGLLDIHGRAMIEPERFTGLGNLTVSEKELCLALVCFPIIIIIIIIVHHQTPSPLFLTPFVSFSSLFSPRSHSSPGPTHRDSFAHTSQLQGCRDKLLSRLLSSYRCKG